MRKLLLVPFVFAFKLALFSQTLPQTDPQVFSGDDGKIYWPLNLPVYLQISTNADQSDGISLNNGSPAKTFSATGLQYISYGGDNGAQFPVYVDGDSPETSISFSGAKSYESDRKYFGSGLSIQLSSSDDLSGVKSNYISINGGVFAETSASINLDKEQSYNLRYASSDQVGNTETPKEEEFIVDLSAPRTNLRFTGEHISGKIISRKTTLVLDATDGASGVQSTVYFIDNNKSQAGSTINLEGIKDGDHVLNYQSVDNVGNKEITQNHAFFLDGSAPTVTAEINGAQFKTRDRIYLSPESRIRLSSNDNRAGVRRTDYTINDGATMSYTTPFKLPNEEGNYSIKFRAVDNVGNEGEFASSNDMQSLYLDNTPPTSSLNVEGTQYQANNRTYLTSESMITIAGNDIGSGIGKIEFNRGTSTETYINPINFVDEGEFELSIAVFDNVLNASDTTIQVSIDNTAPEISWNMTAPKIGTQNLNSKPQPIDVYSKGTALVIDATDTASGLNKVFYTLNNGTEREYLGQITMDEGGLITLSIRSVDHLGNESVLEKIEFVIL